MDTALRPSVPSSLRPSVSPRPTRRERTRRPAALERLDEAAAVVVAGDSDRARILLADILADSPAQGTAAQRLARLFATALLARLRGDGAPDES